MSDFAQPIVGIAILPAFMGYFWWQATRKREVPKPYKWGDSHNPPSESSGAVQAGYDVLHPGSQ